MSLAHAHDALGDQVTRFYNDMLGDKTKELPAREWARRFMRWFSEYEFERNYIETIKFIEECQRREAYDKAASSDTALPAPQEDR